MKSQKHTRLQSSVISRRAFINILIAAATIPLILWWIFVGKRDLKLNSKTLAVNIGKDISKGISFYDDIIVVKEGESIRAYEAKCTHLGCSISKAEGDELVCPCHGSRFDDHGKPVKGPANESLKELIIKIDSQTNDYIIWKKT